MKFDLYVNGVWKNSHKGFTLYFIGLIAGVKTGLGCK